MTLRNKIHLSLIVFAVLAIILIAFVIYPLFLEIQKNSQELISQRINLFSFEKEIENLEKFKTLYPEIKPGLEKIDTLFINPEVPVEFVSFLEKTARDCQISLEISSALPLKDERDPWSSLVFQITSIGSFPKFLKFLEKLEASHYLVEIQNLSISQLTKTELRFEEFEESTLNDVKTALSIKVFTK